MPSDTIQYETTELLQALTAHDRHLLRDLGEAFHVQITSRDGWVKLDGEEDAISGAREVLHQVEKVRRQGGEISDALFKMLIQSVLQARGGEPADAVMGLRLLGSPRRPPVLARTPGQVEYLQAMKKHEVVFGVGCAGTGKTFLAMAQALQCLRERSVHRVILARPAVEAGEALGFLPGDLKEKILPYLRPLYDAIYDLMENEEAERLIERGFIEIAPLAYMRGRTLKNAFIILDEAQNTTAEQMFMFLTRLGEGSRCVITGDPSQIDLKRHVKSGLIEALQALDGVQGIKIVPFATADVVRLPVVQRIIEAYGQHRAQADA